MAWLRWDSPFAIAMTGTLVIHAFLAFTADALIDKREPLDLPAKPIEIEVQPPPKATPPPEPAPKAVEPEPVKQAPKPVAKQVVKRVASREPPPPPVDTPPPPSTPNDPGGAPVVALPDVAPSATGVAVVKGARTNGPTGLGGTGDGPGSGAGSGRLPKPMSVATIKSRAMPKGDYGYLAAGKDYPVEAKQLGIEGTIRVKLVVDETGVVKSAVLLNKLGHGLDELALQQAMKIEFTPAKDTDDQPVASVVIWTFNMTLPK